MKVGHCQEKLRVGDKLYVLGFNMLFDGRGVWCGKLEKLQKNRAPGMGVKPNLLVPSPKSAPASALPISVFDLVCS